MKIIDGQKLELQYQEDKIISINREIRDAIGKSGEGTVTVTLYLHN